MDPHSKEEPGKVIARVAAGTALTMGAATNSRSFDKFGSWLLATYGVGLALLVSNIDKITPYISAVTISSSAYLFLAAFVFCIAQKYVSMVICGGAESAEKMKDIDTEHMDIEEFLQQLLAGIPQPARMLARRVLEPVKKGDFAATGRMHMRLSAIQGSLVMIEAILLLIGITKIVNQINA